MVTSNASGVPDVETVRREIESVLREHLGSEVRLDLDAELARSLRLDSLRRLTLVLEIENRFRIALDDDAETSIVTGHDLVRAIHARLADATEPPS